MEIVSRGNPMMAGLGVCDPHIHVFDGTAYLYATRDASPFSRGYRMEEWWIWSSTDLQRWRLRYRLSPAQTYMGRGFSDCWATDAARRGGRYFWYLAMNDMGRSGNPYYRDFFICRVRYGSGGEIMPFRVSPEVNLAE